MTSFCQKIIAGQCRIILWPAIPDWPLMPEYQCWIEAMDYRKKCRCWIIFFSGIPTFWHLHMIFLHHIAGLYTFPLPAVWACSGCTFHYHQHQPYVWTCRVLLFSTASSMNMQGVSLSTTSNVKVKGVSQSINCSVYAQDVCILFHLCKMF